MKRNQKKIDDKAQSKAFIETARKIGADEERSASDLLIGRLAKSPPESQDETKRRQRKKPGK